MYRSRKEQRQRDAAIEQLPPRPEHYRDGRPVDREQSQLSQIADMYASGEIDLAKLEAWTEEILCQ